MFRRSAQVACEEARHVAAHVFVGIIFPGIFVAVAEDAFDAERVELGLERLAEAGVMDPLPRLGVGGKRCVRLGVKQDNRRVAGRDVIEGRCLLEELVGSR